MLRIRGKLLVAYLLPSVIVLLVFAWLAYGTMRRTLEGELSNRLVSIAKAAASQLEPALVQGLVRAVREEDDAQVRRSRTYRNLRARLAALREKIGVRAIAVFDRRQNNLVEDSGKVPVGEHDYSREADRTELAQVFAGSARASLLFTGKDGVVYKSGYAPIQLGKNVLAALAIDAPAEFFTVLSELRTSLLLAVGALVVVVAAISFLVASGLSRPLRALVGAARRIGSGKLDRPIDVKSRDEVGFLAQTMEEMRLRIQARDREMQMMLAGIAHEVRNPLGGIELYAGLLREELGEDPKRRGKVEKIERELDYLKHVVNDFLDFTRKGPLDTARIDVEDFLRDLEALVGADARSRGVEITIDVADGAERLVADGDKLRRALLNLIRNSLQAMPEGGRLHLNARREGDSLMLSVGDSGEGISAEVQREVLTPFFTTRERGTGLGLAFVKKITEQHRGTLEIQSELGSGTTVILTFPLGER